MTDHFKEGIAVAMITVSLGERRISQAKVTKVRKDKKFYISFLRAGEWVPIERMWTPDKRGQPTAWEAGHNKTYSRMHLEPWTSEHIKEQAELNFALGARRVAATVKEAIGYLDVKDRWDRDTLRLIHQVLSTRSDRPECVFDKKHVDTCDEAACIEAKACCFKP